jgi:PKD repeat protein
MSNGCQGIPLPFTNTSTGSISSFVWDFGDGNMSGTDNPQNTYSSAGSYVVSLSATSPSGCNNSATHAASVYSTPQTDFSLALPPFSCSGTPSQFNDATPNPTDSNLTSWSWTFGDAANGTSMLQNPQYTYPLAGLYDVGLTVGTNFGCTSFVQKTILITQSPVVSFSSIPACVNQPTQFTDTSTGSIKSWLWKIGNSTYTFYNPVHVFGGSGTYNAQLTVTDNNHCVAQTAKSISVPVDQFPDFSSQGTCATKSALFQDITPVSADPFVSYSWDFAGQGSASGSLAQFTFPTPGDFSVRMDATAQSGCVYFVSKSVTIGSPPVANFSASPQVGGVPLIVQFNNTSANATSYLWHFHDPTDSTSSLTDPAFTFLALGDYVVDLDAMNTLGCSDTFSKVISGVVPKVDVSLLSLQLIRNPTSGEWETLFVIENAGNLPVANPTVQVELSGNVTLKEDLNVTIPPGQSTSQILSYSVLPGKVDYLCLQVDVDQDVTPDNNKQCASLIDRTILFSPYPNPTGGELRLDWIAVVSDVARITIFTAAGAKAVDQSVEATAVGLNQIRMDVSNLSPGIYMLVFSYAGLKKTFRFSVN